ncbi:tetratricopeptide (TPR) repeat protein [Nocardioides luteus]|uniref:MalT-like TPR region domain-containing protein n=1 Tax=Nocardioides luteus TaxID=1844 RepID=A0ABQ5T037_9ACTN|nr:hypothetical protein [Nocardioides luteus]MDR7313588.1 tetratricopeptide (TPR) repeat protein [Nocardioides luteus]GGR69076.1 hypothetical protein GCM10010197_40740 [Nocardioides luteus]GLJ69210.1 hypothetical protein GCM10017579_32460 [Nocardioides luteus]
MLTFDAARDEAAATTALFQLAMAETYAGEPQVALETCERVLALSGSRGERWSRAYALWVAGLAHRDLGAADEARRAGRAALEHQREFGDGICIALTVELLAWLDADAGERDRAATLMGAAAAVWRQLGTAIDAFGPHITAESSRMSARLEADLGGGAGSGAAVGAGLREQARRRLPRSRRRGARTRRHRRVRPAHAP